MEKGSFITCRNSEGLKFRGTLLRFNRHSVAFEVYTPYSIIKLSEMIPECQIITREHLVYSGHIVITHLIDTGHILICEGTLDEGQFNTDLLSSLNDKNQLKQEFAEFLKDQAKIQQVKPDIKIFIADMQIWLTDVRQWLKHIELGVEYSFNLSTEIEQRLIKELLPIIEKEFYKFENIATDIKENDLTIHHAYVRKQLHHLLMCAPFVHRVISKPLGYAGDYEMVNMMLGDPVIGSSLFTKMINIVFLKCPAVQAHRNRIEYLTQQLNQETHRVSKQEKKVKIFNLGCGPAQEIQKFLLSDDICEQAAFTLVDFDKTTLQYTKTTLDGIKAEYHRATSIKIRQKSVQQILKHAAKDDTDFAKNSYDLVYCAGLFDYLSDRICQRLMDILYSLLTPGGLLIATNVETSNPVRHIMEYILEWYLVYRDKKQLLSLKPNQAPMDNCKIQADITGVNIFLEVRKPEHDEKK